MTTAPSIKPLKGSISNYFILPLALPTSPSLKGSPPATHYVYLRRHTPKVPTPDDDRTLFAVNVPIDATEAHFRTLLADISGGSGRVERADFDSPKRKPAAIAPPPPPPTKTSKKRKRDTEEGAEKGNLPEVWNRELHASGSTALVVFVDKPALEATLKALNPYIKGKVEPPVWGKGVENKLPALGFQRYLSHHRLRFLPRDQLQASVDAYMTRYNATETARARALARKKSVPDEDGFVTVVRGAKIPDAEQLKEKIEEKKKGVFLDDFYRFQVREERKKEAEGLKRRFEEDRKRVGEMRGRRFRPQ